MNVFIELHFERATVVATGQRIGQSLLLNLSKQRGVVYRDRNLIGHRTQQENFVFMPDTRAIRRRHLQRAHQAFVKNQGHNCEG